MAEKNFNAGHTLSGGDTGCRGNGFVEEILTRQTVDELIKIFKSKGEICHKVAVDWAATMKDSLNEQCRLCDSHEGATWNIVIHFNASSEQQGHGSEIFTYGGKVLPQATRILENLNKLGFANRGIKPGDLDLINKTKAETLYIECCFIDNVIDANLLKKHGVKNIAMAIAKGFLGESFSVSDSSSTTNANFKGIPGTVTADVLNVRNSASTNSSIIGSLTKGQSVDIYKKVGDWYSIYYGDHGGYVHANYISAKQTGEVNKKKMRNAVVYANDVDKRAASYLVDHFNTKGEDGHLVHIKDYKPGMASSVYAVGGSCDNIKANVYLKGGDREETLKMVCKRMGWDIKN